MKDISKINEVISAYFEAHSDADIIPVKRLMPKFIAAGVFVKDKKNGLPIRLVLRELDEKNELHLIPSLHVVRKEEHSFWYFMREGHVPVGLEVENIPAKEESKKELKKLMASEENYVLDLCDTILEKEGLRHHGFNFLLANPQREGKPGNPIPCDLYYPELKLVIEFNGHPHLPLDDAQIAQRSTYAARKRDALAKNKIQLLEIEQSHFDLNDKKQIKRDRDADINRIHTLMADLKL